MAWKRMIVFAALVLLSTLVAPATAATSRTWFAQTGSAGAPAFRPHRLWVSGDGAFFVKRMRWVHWGGLRARGHGTVAVDNCDPDCASGTYHYYPGRVRLSDAKRVCGRHFFTRLVVVYTKGHPEDSPARVVIDPYRIYC